MRPVDNLFVEDNRWFFPCSAVVVCVKSVNSNCKSHQSLLCWGLNNSVIIADLTFAAFALTHNSGVFE